MPTQSDSWPPPRTAPRTAPSAPVAAVRRPEVPQQPAPVLRLSTAMRTAQASWVLKALAAAYEVDPKRAMKAAGEIEWLSQCLQGQHYQPPKRRRRGRVHHGAVKKRRSPVIAVPVTPVLD